MDRKDFLSQVGIGAAGLLFLGCLGSCEKESTGSAAPSNVDFTLDLTTPSNVNLATIGGSVYSNGIIVAKTVSGNYIAVSSACTHQGTNVEYKKANDNFYCPNHGAQFSTTGAVVNGPANRALTAYKVSVSGTQLRIYS